MNTLPVGATFTLSLAAYLTGALTSLVTWRTPALCRYICCGSGLTGAIFGGFAAVFEILQGTPVRWSISSGIPLFAYSFDYDALAGFFNLTLAILAGAVSIYSFGYLKEFEGKRNIGFGIKAGVIPFHIWLPAAHPVAPSNISSLLSGVVLKAGIYGMARIFLDGMGVLPSWAGLLVLIVGVASAVLGVLYALMEHDLKRLLAYHSIENIGIILVGLGAALVFRVAGHPQLAAVALIAAMFHTLNHAIFKCLLFLGAGSVLHSTGTRNMEELGGLIRPMPVTALCFLIGAVAISGLPPLNGFVSEWLTYQSLLAGFGATGGLTRI